MALAAEAGISRKSVTGIRVGKRVSAHTYARIAAIIGYDEAMLSAAALQPKQEECSVAFPRTHTADVVVTHPVGGVMHITMQPGTNLTITMDEGGIHAESR